MRETFLWSFFRDPINCAIVAISLNHAAFLAEIFRGALLAVPKGNIEASAALCIPPITTYSKVLLPLAFRLGFSGYRNEFVYMIKSTALVGAITVTDLLEVANDSVLNTYDPTTPIVMAAAFYWCIVMLSRRMFDLIEGRLHQGTLREG